MSELLVELYHCVAEQTAFQLRQSQERAALLEQVCAAERELTQLLDETCQTLRARLLDLESDLRALDEQARFRTALAMGMELGRLSGGTPSSRP